MDEKNTQGEIRFIIEHALWMFIAWLWYKNTLFKCLDTHSLKESRMILFALLLCCSILGILLEMKRQRNGISVLMNLLGGFGLYSVFSYLPIWRKQIMITLIFAVILSATYSLFILCHRIKNRSKLKKILVQRIIKSFTGFRNIMCVGLAVIMISIGIRVVFGTSLLRPTVAPAKQSNIKEQTIANNMETLLLLKEDRWKALSVEEKLGVLQTVANIEQRYLGLPNELNVGTAKLREGVKGQYSDFAHEIIVDMDSLLNASTRELVDTIAHEAYHSFQHRMVDAYDEASDDLKPLLLYYDATQYKEEFANYKDGSNDLCGYYSQKCESIARRYASNTVDEYFDRINEYLTTVEANTSNGKKESYQFLEDAEWYDSGIARYIGENGLIGYVEISGKEITEPMFQYGSDMRHGIALVRENGESVYYIDSCGKKLGTEYADGYEFNFDRKCAIVKTADGSWGFIDMQGELFFSGADRIEDFPIFSYVTTAVIDGHAALIELDNEDGLSCEVKKEFDEYVDITYLCYGAFAMVTDRDGHKGVVFRDGIVIIPAEYVSIDYELVSADGDNRSIILFKLQKQDGSFEFVKQLY